MEKLRNRRSEGGTKGRRNGDRIEERERRTMEQMKGQRDVEIDRETDGRIERGGERNEKTRA